MRINNTNKREPPDWLIAAGTGDATEGMNPRWLACRQIRLDADPAMVAARADASHGLVEAHDDPTIA